MTGSGETGLCIGLPEEAIMDNIPAIVVDPKGGISNLQLTFPEFRGRVFAHRPMKAMCGRRGRRIR